MWACALVKAYGCKKALLHIACGGKKGAARVLREPDFLNIYEMANH